MTKLDSQSRQDGPTEPDRILNGWREIAAYFGRTQSTVKRWAAERNLPVYRVAGESARRGLPVFAHTSELAAWRRSGGGQTTDDGTPALSDSPQLPDTAAPPDAPTVQEAEDAPPPVRPGGFLGRRRRQLVAGLLGVAFVASTATAAVWLLPALSAKTVATASIPDEARELYLRGTYLWNRRTPEGIEGAIAALGRALEIHPDYAEAHAGLAMTYNLARQYSGMSGFEAYPKAEAHARRAVALDPTSGFAQSVLAFVEFHWLWDVETGLARFEEALRLEPESANTLMWYASSLLHVLRADDALPIISRAQQLDPDSSAVLHMKAVALFHSGQNQAAEDLLREIMSRDPQFAWSYPSMSYIQLRRGDYDGYLQNYARLGELIQVARYGAAAEAGVRALARGGVKAMAAAMIEVETEYYERGEALAWDVARHHAIVDDVEGALHWLNISLERHEERLIGILIDTAFDPLRDASGFKRLLADIGLATDG